MIQETQETISEWAKQLGPKKSNLRIAIRMQQELAELLTALAIDDDDPNAVMELADIFIVGYTLAARMGKPIHFAIDWKMEINRGRKWKLDGTGCAQHED